MKRRRQPARPAVKQPLPPELIGQCLSFLQRKFYEHHADTFGQDRQRLLKWVVLWPAKWLDERGVSLPLDRYREIFMKVMMDALVFNQQTRINYLPAYLRQVIESHFRVHGEDYYDEAKSIRTLADQALAVAGKATQAAPDPLREMAKAARLIKGKTKGFKQPLKGQLNLFDSGSK